MFSLRWEHEYFQDFFYVYPIKSHLFRPQFVQISKSYLFTSQHRNFPKEQKSQSTLLCLEGLPKTVNKHTQTQTHTHLLTLWHRNGETLWARLLSSNWCFGGWDPDPSDVRVVAIGAVVSPPVVVPGAADRLRSDMIVKQWMHSSTFMVNYWFGGRKSVILPTRQSYSFNIFHSVLDKTDRRVEKYKTCKKKQKKTKDTRS